MRYVLPLLMLLGVAVLLAVTARDSFLPALDVTVVPVVVRADHDSRVDDEGAGQAEASEAMLLAQAPGWVEPDPYAIAVQALTSGVVEQVLVLEGDVVSKGQVVARLVADDALLAVRRARAQLVELRASVERSRAELAVAEARLSELDEDLERRRGLIDVGGISLGELRTLEHRRRGHQSEVDVAKAAIVQAQAAVERQAVVLEHAELTADRTAVRSPADGIVLTRSVVPGTRIVASGEPTERDRAGLVSLYDPESLQVRADVPLADAGKVVVGGKALMTTEAVPGVTFQGEVTRIVQRADIQRNTLQVKVRIEEPTPQLKPEMLARVRFLGAADEGMDRPATGQEGSLRVHAPTEALLNRTGDRAGVWVIAPTRDRRSHRVEKREITVGREDEDTIRVRSGLRPGDRLVVDPPANLTSGARVRVSPASPHEHTNGRGS